jgi:hypothetical protein
MGDSIIDGGIVENYPTTSTAGTVISSGYDQGVIVDEGYSVGNECGCDSCGVSGAYFEDGCCGRGGCPQSYGPCWLGNLGKALRTGEYFGGAVAFQSPLFTEQGQDLPEDVNQLASDSSFGFYGGFNFGIPLCRLTCGLLSGQFGVRSVSTNFDGNEFTTEDRRQIFVTTGVYRRVDYGLQFGVVADFLHEEWFTETDLIQLRAESLSEGSTLLSSQPDTFSASVTQPEFRTRSQAVYSTEISSTISFRRLTTIIDSTTATQQHGAGGAKDLSAGPNQIKLSLESTSTCRSPIESPFNRAARLI